MHKWLQKWLQKCYCMHSWWQGCGGLYVNDVIMWYDATIFEIYILFKRDIDTWNMLNIILRNYSWAYLDMHINEKNKFSNHACIHMQFKFINGMITVIFISCTSACISPISCEASPLCVSDIYCMHCYATWCPITTRVVASQCPSSNSFLKLE